MVDYWGKDTFDKDDNITLLSSIFSGIIAAYLGNTNVNRYSMGFVNTILSCKNEFENIPLLRAVAEWQEGAQIAVLSATDEELDKSVSSFVTRLKSVDKSELSDKLDQLING